MATGGIGGESAKTLKGVYAEKGWVEWENKGLGGKQISQYLSIYTIQLNKFKTNCIHDSQRSPDH